MKKYLSLLTISLPIFLFGCFASNNTEPKTSSNDKSDYYDGQKIYTNSDIKGCGIEGKNNYKLQRCDKITGDFITGVLTYYNAKGKLEGITYYKDGFYVKQISYDDKTGNVINEVIIEFDKETFNKKASTKSFFKNGNIREVSSYVHNEKTEKTINEIGKSFYITGVLKEEIITDKDKNKITITYDKNGKFLIKSFTPYQEETDKNADFEQPTTIYYDQPGKLFTGTAEIYHSEYPDVFVKISSYRNGKMDGIQKSFFVEDKSKKVLAETTVNYINGKLVEYLYVSELYSSKTYYFDDTLFRYNKDNESGYSDIICKYKGLKGRLGLSEVLAKEVLENFEKDKTKSPCPKFDFIKTKS